VGTLVCPVGTFMILAITCIGTNGMIIIGEHALYCGGLVLLAGVFMIAVSALIILEGMIMIMVIMIIILEIVIMIG
jgi:hypothetical protein